MNVDPAASLASDVARLGYPGFAYLCSDDWPARNAGDVLLSALAQDDLEARLAEALPWVAFNHWPADCDRLVTEAKQRDLQNRLGFVVSLARQLAERADDEKQLSLLRNAEHELGRHRLNREDTLCRASMPPAERQWMMEHRSAEAVRWNLLTDWTADHLRYAA